MCICSTTGLKITLLLLIHVAAGFNAAQVAKDITMLDKLVGHHHIVLITSLVLCVLILIVLIAAVYAAIKHHILILNISLVSLILKCVAKAVIMIVCVITESNLERTAAHFWFLLCWVFTNRRPAWSGISVS
ncbi:uncharacterized protein LOC108028088 isoform X3 [Drosophila biarmipes]|uniref:uncharacterized protein LOC108028088 isoform X3 n=1 Tax=Drosophila biarmipes TaxID=125945 RepID=UPI0007E827E6|nr:uncharacterized protein LOC108028088 isoform X3 [Drosophila biarmipes]